jgi:hypothetical protein
MTDDQRLMTHRRGTWKSAWNSLNKASTYLWSDPDTKKLAQEVDALMMKLDAVIDRERSERKTRRR